MKNKLIFFVTMFLSGFCIQSSYQDYQKVGSIETANRYIPVYCNSSEISDNYAVQLAEQRFGIIPASTKSILVELDSNGQIIISCSSKGITTLRD